MTPKTVMVLAASTYQIAAIRAAKRLGYRVVTVDNRPDNPGHALADASYDVSTTNAEAVLSIAAAERVIGILSPATDVAVPTVAFVAARLGLAGPPPEAAAVVCSKAAFRDFARTNGLPTPRSMPLARDTVFDRALFGASRWLLKPNRSSGSKGVVIVATEDEARDRLAECLSFDPAGEGVLEEFVDGRQCTCEGVLEGGRVTFAVVTDRVTAAPPYVATRGHLVPSSLSAQAERAAVATIESAWRLLGVTDGPFDCDFVVCDETVYILEMTPRVGGNSIVPLVRAATGVDLAEYAVRYACGDAPSVSTAAPRPAALVLLGVDRPGRLRYDAEGADAVRRASWLESLEIDLPQGASVGPFVDGRRRVGEALVLGESREDLLNNVAKLEAALDVRST